MRFLKLIFISIIILSFILTAISLLFPPHLHIAQEIGINASTDKIFSVVSNLHTWKRWNKILSDSSLTNLTVSASGDAAQSDQLQVSIKKDSNDAILIFWKQKNGKQFNGGIRIMKLHPENMTVQWYFDFTFKWYPWEKFTSLVYDRQFDPIIQESLQNLKVLLENNP
jgi:hypothetical protein